MGKSADKSAAGAMAAKKAAAKKATVAWRRKHPWSVGKKRKKSTVMYHPNGRKMLATKAAPQKAPVTNPKPKKPRVITRGKRCVEPTAMTAWERERFLIEVHTKWTDVVQQLKKDRADKNVHPIITLKGMRGKKHVTTHKIVKQNDIDDAPVAYALWGEHWLPGRVYFILSPDTDTDPNSTEPFKFYHGDFSDIVAFAFAKLDDGEQMQCAINLCNIRFLKGIALIWNWIVGFAETRLDNNGSFVYPRIGRQLIRCAVCSERPPLRGAGSRDAHGVELVCFSP
jgi:hypothetical protein